MKKKKIDTAVKGATVWFTAFTEKHPETKCGYAGDDLFVATDGKRRWISCEGCKKTWAATGLG